MDTEVQLKKKRYPGKDHIYCTYCSKNPYLVYCKEYLVIDIRLCVYSIGIIHSVHIPFQEKMFECNSVLFFEGNYHLIAQSENHQLKKTFLFPVKRQSWLLD